MRIEGYPERLQKNLGEYSEEFAKNIHRMVRVGKFSCQAALEVIEAMEVEFAIRTADKVFGAVPIIEAFADDPRVFGLTVEDVRGPAHYIADL